MSEITHLILENLQLVKIAFVGFITMLMLSSCSISPHGIDVGYKAIKYRNDAMLIKQGRTNQNIGGQYNE